jgi:adenylosuccinate synthase
VFFSFDPDALSRIFISSRASLLFDFHQKVDAQIEAEMDKNAIGTTKVKT